ncbi:MAG: DUF885 domain-containing protein [Verrucomicrobia bacterium]|jgi:uncharacterized protein (DUF885 family)|nr:DUF885 domain-containing protein [Verrucomicrobiota bacterium]
MNRTASHFEGLLERYFETLLQDAPTFATVMGVRSAEGKLGELNDRFVARRQRERQTALRSLETISPRELSNEQHLDRLALRSMLLKECEDFTRGRHTLEPNAPQQVLDILFHELMRGDDEPKRAARNLRSLLKQAPNFLEEAGTLIDKPERVWRRVMEQTVTGGAALLEGVETFLQGTQPQPADKAQIRATRRAMEKYRDRVKRRPLAPAGSFAIGTTTLQRRVRDELGLDYTLGQIETLALGEAQRVGDLLKEACARFGRKRSADEILAGLRAQWRPRKPLLELYDSTTREIARGFRAARAVTFPKGDELVVKPVPEFLRTLIPTAAYSQPGAFEKRQRGIFWVNDLSALKKTEAEKLAERQQHFGLSLTCAHEAYPGHHLQFVTANRHPRKWRRLFAHAVFYEGWTLWCEQMMVDLKMDRSPWLRVQQLHDALWRCHRILVDLRLQTRRYGYEQAVRHMQRHLGFTRARAEADVNWYTASPTVPMSYWLGRLENARLHQRLVVGRGWSLQKFNDWLLSFGTIPQSWIEKYGLD